MSREDDEAARTSDEHDYWVVADASGVAFTPKAGLPAASPPAVWAILPNGARVESSEGRFSPPLPQGTRIVVEGSTLHVVREPPLERNVLWSHQQEPLLERMSVHTLFAPDSLRTHHVSIRVVGVIAGAPGNVAADLAFDESWSPMGWSVELDTGGGITTLSADANSRAVDRVVHRQSGIDTEEIAVAGGGFLVWDGGAAPHFPVLRSHLENGSAFEVNILKVTLGNAQVRSGVRKYERSGDRRWYFKDLGSNGREGELEVDSDAVVVQQTGECALVETRYPLRR